METLVYICNQMASVSLFILYSSALSVTYPPFGIRAKLAGNSYCKLHFISIKLAGSTAIVKVIT